MAEFAVPSLSPARVHSRARELVGHHPCWVRRTYQGGLVSIEHFRICSYCGCANPTDVIELLETRASCVIETKKPGKYLLLTPNPVAGVLVRMGSVPVPVFNWRIPPMTLRKRLSEQPSEEDATIAERLVGHIERPLHEIAPDLIRWPFYSEHVCDRQWPEIWAAQGDHHGQEIAA